MLASRAKHLAGLPVNMSRYPYEALGSMSFQSFKHLILFAAILAIVIGSEVNAQEPQEAQKKKDPKPAGKQVESNSGDKQPQPQAQPQSKPQKPDSKPSDSKPSDSKQEDQNSKETLLFDLEMTNICGEKVSLKKYEGKVVLIVNVASKCGFTGQYRPLQALHTKYNQLGLEVVAFPCNQFGKQEPEAEPAISAFCKKKFGIEFDMFAKVDVKGKKQAELFKKLTRFELQPAGKGDIRWNFEKFVIGKDGKPVARFRSNVAPDSEAVVSKLKEALGIKVETPKKETPKKETPKKETPKKEAPKKEAPKKEAPKKETPKKEKSSTPEKQKAEEKKATEVKEDKKSSHA